MAEQKHFSYEGDVTKKKPDIAEAEVIQVELLVPVNVQVRHKSGHLEKITGHLNLTEKKGYFHYTREFDEPLTANVFDFLAGKLAVAADKYAASDDIRREAADVNSDFEELYRQNVGDDDE